jgi:hypothetical protein
MVGWTIQLKPVALIDHLQVVKEMGAAHTLKSYWRNLVTA